MVQFDQFVFVLNKNQLLKYYIKARIADFITEIKASDKNTECKEIYLYKTSI